MVNEIGNADPDSSHTVTVEVTVRDENTIPQEGIEVKLEDTSGGDELLGMTDTDGKVRFLESAGPPPCNRMSLSLTNSGLEEDLGCHNGGTRLNHTFVVPAEDGGGPAAEGPVDGRTILVASAGAVIGTLGIAWANRR